MAFRARQVGIIVLSDNCCSRSGFVTQYCLNTWHDLRAYGTAMCSCEDIRKQTILDGRLYVFEFQEESQYFIDEVGYFNARMRDPPDAYIVLYDVTSRDSLAFAKRALGVLGEGVGEREWVEREGGIAEVRERGIEVLRKRAGDRSVALGKGLPEVASLKGGKDENPRGGLLKTLAWMRRVQSTKESWPSRFTCFPRLPMELQLAILRACLTSPTPVIEGKPYLAGINIAVLRVNKFFHEEGTKIYRTENQFIASRPMYLVADTTWVGIDGRSSAVPLKEGRELAQWCGCTFLEASSRKYEEVQVVVEGLVRDLVARRGNDWPGCGQPSPLPRPKLFRSVVQRVSRMFE
ncbi:hypothetical protein BJX62DRAFT_242148 [Aspergillus germanicus]